MCRAIRHTNDAYRARRFDHNLSFVRSTRVVEGGVGFNRPVAPRVRAADFDAVNGGYRPVCSLKFQFLSSHHAGSVGAFTHAT